MKELVIISGKGKCFMAGVNIHDFLDLNQLTGEKYIRAIQSAYLKVSELDRPVIAAVNGPALGAGLGLAIACDLRVASPTAIQGGKVTGESAHKNKRLPR